MNARQQRNLVPITVPQDANSRRRLAVAYHDEVLQEWIQDTLRQSGIHDANVTADDIHSMEIQDALSNQGRVHGATTSSVTTGTLVPTTASTPSRLLPAVTERLLKAWRKGFPVSDTLFGVTGEVEGTYDDTTSNDTSRRSDSTRSIQA
jgi:hypothetical protein